MAAQFEVFNKLTSALNALGIKYTVMETEIWYCYDDWYDHVSYDHMVVGIPH